MAGRVRAWCFTAWPSKLPDDVSAPDTWGWEWTYLVWGKETCPVSGQLHWQGYVELTNPKGLAALKKLTHDSIHYERRQGTPAEAADYCKKDGDFVEAGEISKQGRRMDLESIKRDIDGGADDLKLWGDHFGACVRYHRSFSVYRSILRRARPVDVVPQVHVLWGPTGTGKSHRAHEAGAVGVYLENGFWQPKEGMGADVILIDEFDPNLYPIQTMLRLVDKWHFTANVKGGQVAVHATIFYLCSNLNPATWWTGGANGEATGLQRSAWDRRCSSVSQLSDVYVQAAQ